MRSHVQGRAAAEPATRQLDAPLRLLVVEDHAMVRWGLRLVLETFTDLRVIGEAADGREAVAQAQALRPDVVVMDVQMPVLDGIAATRAIRAELPEVAVLGITGYDSPDYLVAMLDAGAAGYLVKGASGAELAAAVRAIARGEWVLPAEVAARALLQTAGRSVAERHGGARPLLSERELEVLGEAARGLPNKEIARRLSLSVRTVHTHLGNIFAKLGVGSRTEAVLLALRRGWVALGEPESTFTDGPM
jgi:DNA-binding NarL/FixJ family response regulator